MRGRADISPFRAAYLRSRPDGWPMPLDTENDAGFLARAFVEEIPKDGSASLLTGYYEPEIAARRQPDDGFCHPLYALPTDPSLSHAQILDGALDGQGLEIAYLADPVDRFFLMVQGSGRLVLPNEVLRLGYAGKNGHPYRSLGKEMIARGLLTPESVSAEAIRDWLAAHPEQVTELLLTNPSWVWFREITGLAPEDGPIGTAGVPLTAAISLAVDPAHIPLGAPVLMQTTINGQPVTRLMVAQDTGGVIKGAQRADIYFGTGDAAGRLAGSQQASGQLSVYLPKSL